MERRNNATTLFRMVYPEKGWVALLRRSIFSPMQRVKTATWSRSVNSEDFLIAEADHVQIQPSIRRDLDPSANLASISSANFRRSRMRRSCRCGTVRVTSERKRRKRMAFRDLVRGQCEAI